MEPLKERDEATSLGHRSRFRAVYSPKVPAGVGYYWDSSVLSVWAYPSRWNDSPLASPAVLAVRPSHLAAPSAFWDSPWDVVSIWRTPQDWLAVSALGYLHRQAD